MYNDRFTIPPNFVGYKIGSFFTKFNRLLDKNIFLTFFFFSYKLKILTYWLSSSPPSLSISKTGYDFFSFSQALALNLT